MKPGLLFGQLSSGTAVDVVDADGTTRTVHPHQVKQPDVPGPVVLLLHCPEERHVHSLLQNSHLAHYQRQDANLVAVYHIVPSHLATSPSYQSWLSRFHCQRVRPSPSFSFISLLALSP